MILIKHLKHKQSKEDKKKMALALGVKTQTIAGAYLFFIHSSFSLCLLDSGCGCVSIFTSRAHAVFSEHRKDAIPTSSMECYATQ